MGWAKYQAGIGSLVTDNYDSVYRFAYRLTGRADEAADLTQETFCSAQQNWRQLRDPNRPKPWLFAILRNCYLRRRRDRKTASFLTMPEGFDVPDRLPDASEISVDSADLQAALNDLPEHFRTPIILFYFEEFTYHEIAVQVGIPIGTVMSRLARAKSYLKQRLATAVRVEG
jgi:RNA polymerase sigma-70 factor (ECF subfamily)